MENARLDLLEAIVEDATAQNGAFLVFASL
jgi:hypothetical protein